MKIIFLRIELIFDLLNWHWHEKLKWSIFYSPQSKAHTRYQKILLRNHSNAKTYWISTAPRKNSTTVNTLVYSMHMKKNVHSCRIRFSICQFTCSARLMYTQFLNVRFFFALYILIYFLPFLASKCKLISTLWKQIEAFCQKSLSIQLWIILSAPFRQQAKYYDNIFFSFSFIRILLLSLYKLDHEL